MKYKNTKSKLNKIYQKVQNTEQEINQKETKAIQTRDLISRYSPSYDVLNKIYDYSTDWEVLNLHTFEGALWHPDAYVLYKEWRINLLSCVEKVLPFIDIKILLKSSTHTIDYSKVRTGHVINVHKIEEGIAHSPEIIAGINYGELSTVPVIKSKLLVKIYNPEQVR